MCEVARQQLGRARWAKHGNETGSPGLRTGVGLAKVLAALGGRLPDISVEEDAVEGKSSKFICDTCSRSALHSCYTWMSTFMVSTLNASSWTVPGALCDRRASRSGQRHTAWRSTILASTLNILTGPASGARGDPSYARRRAETTRLDEHLRGEYIK